MYSHFVVFWVYPLEIPVDRLHPSINIKVSFHVVRNHHHHIYCHLDSKSWSEVFIFLILSTTSSNQPLMEILYL